MSEHQFLSDPHFGGNALRSQLAKVFRGLFILMLLVSLAGWQTSPANAADLDPAVTCYKLTLDHTGLGTNPIAAPTKSTGCNAGEYVAGEVIALSGAVPQGAYQIGGWRGTINNGRLGSTNTVIMPASSVATAGVDYVLVLHLVFHADTYPELPDLSAPGTIAPPGNTTYAPGQSFMVTATPNAGWTFVGWGGNLTGTANPVSVMMSQEILAQAYFIQTGSVCHTLILNHTGNGTTPDPKKLSPLKSSACQSEGQYVTGEVVTISGAIPGTGSEIGGWRGTNNNASHSGTNTLTMPAGHVFVYVDYSFINAKYVYLPSIQR